MTGDAPLVISQPKADGKPLRVTFRLVSLSLLTVQVLVEVRLSEHTPGAESRDTVTVGLT
jgi:hypothetical protein